MWTRWRAFERRLIFTDAAWDRYLAGESDALTEQQKHGALLFYGAANPAANCAVCHAGDLFTDLAFHDVLAPQLGPGKGHGDSAREDFGRGGVTFDARDRYAFRTPSLRNVALTAPYFHSGAYPTLADVVRHHAGIWEAVAGYDPSAFGVPPDLYSSLRSFDAQAHVRTAAPQLAAGMPLSDKDIADLVAFLQALTDPAAQDLGWLIPDAVPSGSATRQPDRGGATCARSTTGRTTSSTRPTPAREWVQRRGCAGRKRRRRRLHAAQRCGCSGPGFHARRLCYGPI